MNDESSSAALNKNERTLFALILITALLIKILFALFIQAPIRSDSADYLTLASGILKGQYAFNGKPTAYVGCGYPLFLSGILYIFGEGQFYIRVIQSVLELGTAYFFFNVSRNYLNIKYSLMSLAIFSFLPSNIIFSQAVLSESLFGFFSMAVLSLLLRDDFPRSYSMIFISGLLFGYAVLIRTAFLPVFILIPLFFYLFRNKLFAENVNSHFIKCTLAFVLGMIIIIAPWSIRNKIAVNTFSLGTTTGINFYAGSNPDATGTYYPEMFEKSNIDFNDEAVRDKEYIKLGIDYAAHNPLKFLILGIKKTGYLFSSERMAMLYFMDSMPGETSTQVYKRVNPFISLLVNIPYFMIMIFGTWGLLGLKEKRFFIYGSILIWMLTVFMFIALARYHYVLIPFFIIGTANYIQKRKKFFSQISFPKKVIGLSFNIFLTVVWAAEFYLLIK